MIWTDLGLALMCVSLWMQLRGLSTRLKALEDHVEGMGMEDYRLRQRIEELERQNATLLSGSKKSTRTMWGD